MTPETNKKEPLSDYVLLETYGKNTRIAAEGTKQDMGWLKKIYIYNETVKTKSTSEAFRFYFKKTYKVKARAEL